VTGVNALGGPGGEVGTTASLKARLGSCGECG
jgi:hypothetical protein